MLAFQDSYEVLQNLVGRYGTVPSCFPIAKKDYADYGRPLVSVIYQGSESTQSGDERILLDGTVMCMNLHCLLPCQ
jgi:hypothetical protein